MPQSLSKLYVHLVFSTKNRQRVLMAADAADLHAYIGGTLHGLGCVPVEINTEPDHAHLLFLLGRAVTLGDVVGGVKGPASSAPSMQRPPLPDGSGRKVELLLTEKYRIKVQISDDSDVQPSSI